MDKLFQDAEYRPADYEAQAGRYSYRVGRRIYRRWDCIVARCLTVSAALLAWCAVLALLLGGAAR